MGVGVGVLTVLAVAVWGAAGTFAAKDSSDRAAASRADGPLVINYTPTPITLDPAMVCSLEDDGFISSLYVTLIRYGDKPIPGAPSGVRATQEDTTKFRPYLAKSWKVTDGGKTYTFTLRSDAKFPSGRPVDANAVKFSLERNLTVGACGAYFTNAGQTTGNIFKSITAPTPTTFVIKLTRPEPLIMHSLTQAHLGVVDPGVVNANGGVQKGKPNAWMASHAAGSGPYLLKSYEPGRQAVFVANPGYLGPKPRHSTVIVNFIPSDPTLLLQTRTGKADITVGLTKKSVASLKGNSCCNIVAVDTASWQLIGLPNKVAPFNNRRLREALTYAVPYQDILDKVAFGYGKLYYGPYAPAFPSFRAAIARPRSFDLDRATRLIEQSGAKLPINVDMVIREGVLDQEQIATIVQGVWRQLGVNIRIRKLSSAEYEKAIYATPNKTLLVRFDGPSVTEPAWLLEYDLRCVSIFNTSDYCNARAEALLSKARAITSPAARQKIWDQIARMWVSDSPRIPVYADTKTFVLKKGVRSFHFAQDNFDFNRWGK
jgi:peptide/nickel transport system substrate-binding protein